jgi:hypothetical protein
MINELLEKITIANKKYRLGEPIMSDSQYDILIDEAMNDEIYFDCIYICELTELKQHSIDDLKKVKSIYFELLKAKGLLCDFITSKQSVI